MFAVVVTLLYIATQVRQSKEALDANTRSLEESRKLGMAQTYQHRGLLITEQLISLRDSPYISVLSGDIPPEEESEDWLRYRAHMRLHMNYCDNLHYQRSPKRA